MSGTGLSALHELSHRLLTTPPSGRIRIFIFTVKETDSGNQNELFTVTRLKGNEARSQMWLCLGDKAICFSPKLQKLPLKGGYEGAYLLPALYILSSNVPS